MRQAADSVEAMEPRNGEILKQAPYLVMKVAYGLKSRFSICLGLKTGSGSGRD